MIRFGVKFFCGVGEAHFLHRLPSAFSGAARGTRFPPLTVPAGTFLGAALQASCGIEPSRVSVLVRLPS